MPNYCDDCLIIKGSAKDVKEFHDKYLTKRRKEDGVEEAEKFSFDKFVPQPERPEDCDPRYVIKHKKDAEKRALHWDPREPRKWFDWYEWNINNWGTKWDAFEANFSYRDGDSEIWIWHTTAWSPGVPVYKKVQDQFPNLEVSACWAESGNDFVGILRKDGTIEEESLSEKGSLYNEVYLGMMGYEEEPEEEE